MGVLSISKIPNSFTFDHFYSWCRKEYLLKSLRPTEGTGEIDFGHVL